MTNAVNFTLLSIVSQKIREKIANKVFKPGQKIPSIATLAEEFSVGQGTIRRVIEQLIEDNVLISYQGKGVFVQSYIQGGFWNKFHRFQRMDGSLIMNYRPQVVCFEYIPAGRRIAEKLGIASRELVIHWRRIMSVDGVQVGVDDGWLPRKFLPNLTPEHFIYRTPTDSVYAIYEKSDHILICHSTDNIAAMLMPEDFYCIEKKYSDFID